MNIKHIAGVANVSESTVRNWIGLAKTADISAKTAKARETSIAADFTLEEVISIVRAGGNETLADLLAENAKQSTGAQKGSLGTARLSGPVLRELQKIYHPNDLQARLDCFFGWSDPVTARGPVTPTGLPVVPALESAADGLSTALSIASKGIRTVSAVAGKEIKKLEAAATQDRLNRHLNFGGER